MSCQKLGSLLSEMKRERICFQKVSNNQEGKDIGSQDVLICMNGIGAVMDTDENTFIGGGHFRVHAC